MIMNTIIMIMFIFVIMIMNMIMNIFMIMITKKPAGPAMGALEGAKGSEEIGAQRRSGTMPCGS